MRRSPGHYGLEGGRGHVGKKVARFKKQQEESKDQDRFYNRQGSTSSERTPRSLVPDS